MNIACRQSTNKANRNVGIGKWIGDASGFMAFGPLGTLADIILGSFFEEEANMTGQSLGGGTNYDNQYTWRNPYAGGRNSFLFSMLVMASYIIRVDGKIAHSEMEYVRQFLRRNFGEIAVSQDEGILLELFDQAKRTDQGNNTGFKNTIQECGIQTAYNLSYEERLQLLALLAEIAKSDGSVCAAGINALKEVAMVMGVSDKEAEFMSNLKGNPLDDAYKVLEIEPTATDGEVRTAYRRMAAKHRPDKVADSGEDIRKAANEKFRKINEAKERIYQSRGLK